VPAKKALQLVVRFFTKNIGNFDAALEFESFFSLKKYSVSLQGVADFPSVSQLPKNLYWSVKKARPAAAPESYLSKVFVTQEGVFDFGPLLVGKNPDRRGDAEVRKVNSVTFRVSN
jgi:hydrocephalus-inducing protein